VASKIYILGKMTGIPFFNFPAFDAAATRLMVAGHKPLSPADIDREAGFDAMSLPVDWDWDVLPDCLNLRDVVRRDVLAIIDEADGYYCLPGWEASKGARAEAALCEWLGLEKITI